MKIKLKIPKAYKLLTSNSSCIFTISVGYDECVDGEELSSIFETLNNTFQSCIISVCDSLQKYNLLAQNGINMHQAEYDSLLFGEGWLQKNQNEFAALTIPFKIIRWNEWVNDVDFLEKKAFIDDLYANDDGFKDAISMTIKEYQQRLLKRKEINNSQIIEITKYSTKYIKEEAAVMLLQAKKGYSFELYIKKRNSALRYLYQAVISKESVPHMIPIYIKS